MIPNRATHQICVFNTFHITCVSIPSENQRFSGILEGWGGVRGGGGEEGEWPKKCKKNNLKN